MQDKRARFGDTFRERIGPINVVVSCKADDLRTMYVNEGIYPSRGILSSLTKYKESRKDVIPKGISSEGKEWHDFRSKVQKHLLKPKAIEAYIDPMQDVARDFVSKISQVLDCNKEVPNLLEELYKWAIESISYVALDTRLECLATNSPTESDGMKMINASLTKFECLGKLEGVKGNLEIWRLFPTPTWKKLTEAEDAFYEIAFKYINRSLELLKNSSNEDKDLTLLQRLLLEKDFAAPEAAAVASDLMVAGIETTSNTVGFLLYHLAKYPDKQELLYREIQSLLPSKEDKITIAVFNELRYLKACLKESMRLLPVAPAAVRTIDHDIVFGGYQVPAGTLLLVDLQHIYLDENYYSKPLQYFPERWLQKDEKFHPFAFAPFGIGRRSCLGRRLVELQITTVITEIIRNFQAEYHHEDIGIRTGLANAPDKPLKFRFIER